MLKFLSYRQELIKQLFLILLVLVLFTVTMAAPFIDGRDVFGGRVILKINCIGPLVLYAISQPNGLAYSFGSWRWGGLYIQTPGTREYLHPPINITECVTGDALSTPIPCGIGMFFFFVFSVPAKPMLQVGSTSGICPLAALEIPGLPESGIIEGESGQVGVRELIPLEVIGVDVPWEDMLTPAMDYGLGITGGSLDSLTEDQRLDYQYLYGNYGVGYTPSPSQIVESDGTVNALKYDNLKSELDLPIASLDESYFDFDSLFSGVIESGGMSSLSSDQIQEYEYVFDIYGDNYRPSASVAGNIGGEVNFISYDSTIQSLGIEGAESLLVYVSPAEVYLRDEATVDGLTDGQIEEYQYLFNTYGVGYAPTAESLGIGGDNPDIIGYDYARITLSLPTASPETYLDESEIYLRDEATVDGLTDGQIEEYQYLFNTYGVGYVPTSESLGIGGANPDIIGYDYARTALSLPTTSPVTYVPTADTYLRNEATVDGLTTAQKTEYQYLFNTYGVGYAPTAESLGIGGDNPDIIGYDYARITLSLPTASPETYLTTAETYLRTPGVVAGLTPTQLTEYQYLFNTYGTGWASYGF